MSKTELRSWLDEQGEEAYAKFSSALIPGMTRRMWGVRIPLLRKKSKEIARSDWRTFLESIDADDSMEEVMLRGLVLGVAEMDWEERKRQMAAFVPQIDNWSVCDSCCASLKAVRKHREEAWELLLGFQRQEAEYAQRFATVMQLDHFIDDEYVERMLDAWRTLRPAGYYSSMAVGWGLSVAFLKYPRQTLEVLRDEALPVEVRKMACRKILESRRTPEEWRAKI